MPNKYFPLILLAITLFFSCKKYDDGPNISLKSERARLARKWQVQIAYYSLFTDTPSQGDDQTLIWQNLKLEFNKDSTYTLENYNIDLTEKTIEKGTWKFTDDLLKVKTQGIQKRYDVESGNLINQGGKNSTWRIMRFIKGCSIFRYSITVMISVNQPPIMVSHQFRIHFF